jgi:hypothetical protein
MDTLLVPKSTADKPKRKLLDQVRDVMRLKHYNLRTERTYCDWIEPGLGKHLATGVLRGCQGEHWIPNAQRTFGSSLPRTPSGFGNVA